MIAKKGFLIIFICVSFFSSTIFYGQIESIRFNEKEIKIKKFEVADIVFHTKNEIEKHFSLPFTATFKSPKGKELKIHGFYNGERKYIIRFSGNEAGKWTYETHSSVKELNGKKGRVFVGAATAKHGAIVIDKENPKKFSYEDGTSYMLRAFEADWLFALDYDNPKGIPKSEHLLGLLAENGINQIITTLYSYDVRWQKDEKLKNFPEHDYGSRDDIYPFLGTNNKPDFSSLNITFFKSFDRMIGLMHKKDIVAHLMIYVWNKKVKWPKAGSEEDKMFFDYVIKRYQAFPNIIWDIAKEAARRPDAHTLEPRKRVRKLDAFKRLVTVHDYEFCERNINQVDFVSTQDWRNQIYTEMSKNYKSFNKPILNIEHGGYTKSYYTVFPGDYVSPESCLKRNYLCYFAGVYAKY